MRPTRAELETFRDAEVEDLLPSPLRLLFVGINPSPWRAAVGAHFARPGNRFYPALLLAGVLGAPVDPSAGMTDADRTLRETLIDGVSLSPSANSGAIAAGGRGAVDGFERKRHLCPRAVCAYHGSLLCGGVRPEGRWWSSAGRR